MRFHVVTLFPGLFESYLADSILKRAIDQKKIHVNFYNPRDFTKDKHKKVDDRAYGGGPGMIMTVQPIISAVEKAKRAIAKRKNTKVEIFVLSPGGSMFETEVAKKIVLKKYTDIIFICGRYEGIDSRVKKILKAKEISIGNYVLTGGELAAMVCIDSISRQVKGVLGNFDSLEEERVSSHEMYTRPAIYTHNKKKYSVPEVLQNGNHKEIEAWKISSKGQNL